MEVMKDEGFALAPVANAACACDAKGVGLVKFDCADMGMAWLVEAAVLVCVEWRVSVSVCERERCLA